MTAADLFIANLAISHPVRVTATWQKLVWMAHTTVTLTISLPTEMAAELDRARKK
jgi:hypothetical protein